MVYLGPACQTERLELFWLSIPSSEPSVWGREGTQRPQGRVHFLLQCRLQIWDTAGQERFRTITQSYYRSANGAILAYDITKRSSFLSVPHWIEDVRKYAGSNIVQLLIAKPGRLYSPGAPSPSAVLNSLSWLQVQLRALGPRISGSSPDLGILYLRNPPERPTEPSHSPRPRPDPVSSHPRKLPLPSVLHLRQG
ncbi:ras-related protein Rab-43 isoform X3 [Equus quagga]|uniref:ras-related protein Rab-43 isoform X3 n=1 Tax=Equus quagga TaxID=89248 RepID=UPI001EE371C3|nr:ras-related protein Rab-43 isoform X3 [Equus quagga]XP_046503505.1 ras-related protein Rab-43 isoform X3 [Equus quagga]XP_046503585.1 ras-related protein Rab-43 isoform X3 [Equus quagga]XP_046503654.1 ras-related protein Rab-43 isoform X3 [Equus quagga]